MMTTLEYLCITVKIPHVPGLGMEKMMIRITVELVPFGVEDAKRVLTRAEIWNNGTGLICGTSSKE